LSALLKPVGSQKLGKVFNAIGLVAKACEALANTFPEFNFESMIHKFRTMFLMEYKAHLWIHGKLYTYLLNTYINNYKYT